MYILFVIPAYAPFVGGAQTLCRVMARRLLADGCRVTVLTTNAQQSDDFWQPPPPTSDILPLCAQMDGVQVVRLSLRYPWPAPYGFGLQRRFSHQLARLPLPTCLLRPLLGHFTRSMPPLSGLQSELKSLLAVADQVVVVDASWDGLFVAAAQAALAQARPLAVIPLTHTGSTAITAYFRMAHQLAVYRQASAVIALTQGEQQLLTDWGVHRERVHHLSMGADLTDTSAAHIQWEEVRRRYNLPDRFILFLGAATNDKGAFVLAQAAAELALSGKAVHLVYAGTQQHRLVVFLGTLPHQVRAMLQERVHLIGLVDEETKEALLAQCTALALPSRVDSFGIVLLEAWQHGKPVIAADMGGPAEIVAHEKTGLLVPFGDPGALAAAIGRIVGDPALASRMGAAGQQRTTDHYSWDNSYDAFKQILWPAPIRSGPQHTTGKRDGNL